VSTGTVPVTRDGLRVEGHNDASDLGDPLKNVARNPELVAGRNANSRADLELPLSWHDLAIDATDVDAGIQASLVVGVNNVAPE
jgi:hypothetical protein